jgi:hypothetical protein
MFLAQKSPFQRNGAPRGYGQQNGSSIYLDNPQQATSHAEGAMQEFHPDDIDEEKRRQAAAVTAQTQAPSSDPIHNALQALMNRGPEPRRGQPSDAPRDNSHMYQEVTQDAGSNMTGMKTSGLNLGALLGGMQAPMQAPNPGGIPGQPQRQAVSGSQAGPASDPHVANSPASVVGAQQGAPGISTAGPAQDTPARTPIQASIFQGFTPKQAMEGFDFNREQNTGKSAKDAFAYLSNQAAEGGHAAPLHDTSPEAKQHYADWFNSYIKDGMNDLGHTVDSVNGDGFHFHDWQGNYDVDYGRGAGADNAALAWQVQDPNDQSGQAASHPMMMNTANANPLLQALMGGSGQGSDGVDLNQLLQLLMSQSQPQQI